MKFELLTLITALFITAVSVVQNTINGTIIDTLETPLSFANIILYEVGKEEAITGVISNDNRTYVFENPANGTYRFYRLL
ncbi:hypothetical protein [Maribacter sp. Asnod1-A12]|uniref:hypothetical protein n=1 Tax=Maribacter sp. Asnod1-A12 TaxID=3160576 RepID=UPI00386BCC56